MKSHKEITLIIIVLFSTIAFLGGYYAAKELRDDNPAEEAMEALIEHQTGLDIDLSPRTPDVVENNTLMVP